MTNADSLRRWQQSYMPSFFPPPIVLVRGSGCYVWDADGREYLDLMAGIAVNALGHAHPEIIAAVSNQVATLSHISSLYAHEPGILLAERLLDLLGGDGRVFFSNSGAEANEAALKLARRHGRRVGGPTKVGLVAAEGSFHGRTLGTLSVTGQPAKRAQFEPLVEPVTFVPYGDVAALQAAVTDDTAAVLLEPVLGEGGVHPAPAGYLAAARAAATEHGALLVLDEVQTGVGRTGTWFAHQHDGVVPDVVTLAKALGGGLPLGACIGLGTAGTAFEPGDHASTFGGNPVCVAASLAVLEVLAKEDLVGHAAQLGDYFAERVAAIDHPLLAGQRGRGLIRAVQLTEPRGAALETAARDAGFLVGALGPDAVRLEPPLILTAAELDTFLAALPSLLDAARVG